ncbi:HlyD family secretion protein [Roseofilum reptotaenium AO1-A]|uniref:HlyD family secretion protein n=2 Tax=Roseofilum TaxID=1233426 RepID=A0A1L9QQU6_9CYAN|nr:HlyD family secretion protein [Roseofilum reptotaenium AO1-A]
MGTEWKSSKTVALLATTLLAVGGVTAYSLVSPKSLFSEPETPPVVELPQMETVTAVGWLEPKGEVIQLAASEAAQSSRVAQLLVNEGDWVKAGDAIAILDSRDRLQAAVEQARAQVQVAEAGLAQVKAGAKTGDISAASARFSRTQAELEGQIITQRAAIATLEAQLQGETQAQEATLNRIAAELKDAQTNCQRYQTLQAEGAISAQDRDTICLQADTTQQRLEEAQANLNRIVTSRSEQINEAQANLNRTINTVERQIEESQASLEAISEVRPVDIQLAQAELTSAQAALRQAEADLELAYIKAPQEGRVMEIHTYPGEIINSEGIVELGQTQEMTVIAEVYDSDVVKIRPGQIVQVTSDALPENLTGTVAQIGLKVKQQSALEIDPTQNVDARVVEVQIALDPASSELAAGLSNLQVLVEIEL